MPKAPEPPATCGREVSIRGLKNMQDLNGKQGKILQEESPETERLAIRVFLFPGYTEDVLIKRSNIEVHYDSTKISNQDPDVCPICMETKMKTIVGERQNALVMVCCGAKSCRACYERILDGPDPDRCHFCRADTSDTSDAATIRHLQKRATCGDANAIYNLAAYYDMGRMGLAQDQKKAREMYKIAADKGEVRACNDYAVSCRDDEGGPQDFKQARTYYKKAVELGHVKAMTSLGSLYLNGQGGAQDLEEAKRLFIQAGKEGDELGKRYAFQFFGAMLE